MVVSDETHEQAEQRATVFRESLSFFRFSLSGQNHKHTLAPRFSRALSSLHCRGDFAFFFLVANGSSHTLSPLSLETMPGEFVHTRQEYCASRTSTEQRSEHPDGRN